MDLRSKIATGHSGAADSIVTAQQARNRVPGSYGQCFDFAYRKYRSSPYDFSADLARQAAEQTVCGEESEVPLHLLRNRAPTAPCASGSATGGSCAVPRYSPHTACSSVGDTLQAQQQLNLWFPTGEATTDRENTAVRFCDQNDGEVDCDAVENM